jgi:hypothetical protein
MDLESDCSLNYQNQIGIKNVPQTGSGVGRSDQSVVVDTRTALESDPNDG